jgi:MYXO-CTERM domain-containing protein
MIKSRDGRTGARLSMVGPLRTAGSRYGRHIRAITAAACVVVIPLMTFPTSSRAATTGWSTVAPMPTTRAWFAAASGADGRVYAMGGDVSGKAANSVDAYTPTTDSWSAVAPMPTTLEFLAAVGGKDGRIYVMGGSHPDQSLATRGPTPVGTFDAYDPRTNVWVALPSMPTPRDSLAAAAGPDGHLYALGGENASGSAVASVEAYDPSTGEWSSLPPMSHARTALAAVTGADGRIYAIGGVDGAGVALNSVEAYDPTTQTWTSVAPMSATRLNLAAATLPDGTLCAIGGNGVTGPDSTSTVEVYSPRTDRWTSLATMLTARGGLAAASVDNRVYALGGSDAHGHELAVAEAYVDDPQAPAIVPPGQSGSRGSVSSTSPTASSTPSTSSTSSTSSTPLMTPAHITATTPITSTTPKQSADVQGVAQATGQSNPGAAATSPTRTTTTAHGAPNVHGQASDEGTGAHAPVAQLGGIALLALAALAAAVVGRRRRHLGVAGERLRRGEVAAGGEAVADAGAVELVGREARHTHSGHAAMEQAEHRRADDPTDGQVTRLIDGDGQDPQRIAVSSSSGCL